MRVAIESQSLTQVRTGVQYYLYHLLEGLAQLSTDDVFDAFYFSARTRDSLLPFSNTVVTETNHRFPPGRILSGLWKHFPIPKVDWFIGSAEVVHFPNFVIRPVSNKKKVVLTIHDLAFRHEPGWIEQKNLAFLNKHVGHSVDCADVIIAVSEFTRDELIKWYPAARDKVHVVYHGVGQEFTPVDDAEAVQAARTRYKLPKNYLLSVATLEPRKNIAGLLAGFRCAREQGLDCSLVLVGSQGWKCESLVAEIAGGATAEHIVWAGYVEQSDLPLLYQGAQGFVYPTFYEGFGLPCLEAMAMGAPVICSDTSALPEVVGETAYMVDPQDVESIASAMCALIADPATAQARSIAAQARARQFTWQKTAAQTHALYSM